MRISLILPYNLMLLCFAMEHSKDILRALLMRPMFNAGDKPSILDQER
jgi:hypothetical protein